MFLEAWGQREVRVRWKGGKCTGCDMPENPTAANDEKLLILACFPQWVVENHVLFMCEKLQCHLRSPLSVFYQNLPLSVKIRAHNRQWRDALCGLTGVYKESLWNAFPISSKAQGWSTHCCCFVLLTVSRGPSRCSLNTALQDLLFLSHRQGRIQGRRRFVPSSPSLATPLVGTEGLLGSAPAQCLPKTAVFPAGLRIQVFSLHPNKSLMLPHSWLLALAGEGVSVDSVAKPPVPVWTLGAQSHMSGQ